ncbi:MAG: SDR family oxidoreductase [Bacteroidota bacterium]|nr:SDR family oxidoreductase [Bacteroidota bacterium]
MILITGASSGLGNYLFEKFLQNGKNVSGTYHKTVPGNGANYVKVDVSKFEEVEAWIQQACSSDDELILINAAGINSNEIFHKLTPENWDKVLAVNLTGVYNTCRAILPIMRKNKFGRIINISSVVAQKGTPGTASYAASKAALTGLVKTLAVENAKYNITVNNLNLGYFNAGMIKDVPQEMLEKIKKEIPAQRLGEPEEVLNAIEFLIKTPYVNGTDININGAYY